MVIPYPMSRPPAYRETVVNPHSPPVAPLYKQVGKEPTIGWTFGRTAYMQRPIIGRLHSLSSDSHLPDPRAFPVRSLPRVLMAYPLAITLPGGF